MISLVLRDEPDWVRKFDHDGSAVLELCGTYYGEYTNNSRHFLVPPRFEDEGLGDKVQEMGGQEMDAHFVALLRREMLNI